MKAFRLKNRRSGLQDFRKGIKNTGSLWLVFLSLSVSAKAGNWPQWRGPEGTGHSSEQHVPVHWSTNEHVAWRVPLPGPGNSTPIVWGNRVYITQSVEADRRTVMAFDRGSGKLLWQSGVTYAEKETSHETNPQCSPSPVTDGSRVIAWFGSAGLYAYDLEGKELWHRDLGKQSHIWGYGASPVIFRNLCILNFGPGERSFLIALNSKTGETVWKLEEPGGNSGAEMPGEKPKWVGSWSTPILIRCEGREELITAWPNRVAGYQLETGHALWSCDGLNPLVYASPLYSDGIVVVMGGFMGKSLAIKAN